MEFRIRHATDDDIALLAELGAATFRESWLEEGNEKDLEHYVQRNFSTEAIGSDFQDCIYLLAETADDTAGYCKLQCNVNEKGAFSQGSMALHRIYIKKKYQGRNAGARLLETAFEIAKENHQTSVWLGVWNENSGAIRLYELFGFRLEGMYQFVMGTIVSDDYIMRKWIDPGVQ